MARSKQTSLKTEKEKNKKRHQQAKEEKKAFRKANSNKGKGLDSMIAYVDHNGQISDTPPDPRTRVEVKAEDILLGARSFERIEQNGFKAGQVAIYNSDKGYGFIKDEITREKYFFHFSNVTGEVKEGDMVRFELTRGPKGLSAVDVQKL